ncbi:MAG: class II fructose-bisphosphate aldolase [archaeon]
MKKFSPLPGNKLFDALKNEKTIIMACNTRITIGILKGIFRAAKELDAAVMFELAKSESDLSGGYTGLKPKDFAAIARDAAAEIGFDVWALHADHLIIKKGSEEEVNAMKALIEAQVKAGFTSFALDASFLFDFNGKTVEEELRKNIEITAELAKFIEEKMNGTEFGLEVEVGEIGKKNEHGMVLTTPEEAVVFIRELNKRGVFPNVIGIANGSTHGNIYDEKGKRIEQISIDINRTIEVGRALKDQGFNARIAQHGITGTPRELIKEKFPADFVLKGNVGTLWQDIFYEILKVNKPELYKEITEWVLNSFKEEAGKKGIKSEEELLGKYIKFAVGARNEKGKFLFFDKIYSLDKNTEKTLEARAFSEAAMFFDAFHAIGSAQKVREHLKRISS